jgi:rhodanese-related sulfurtransferase
MTVPTKGYARLVEQAEAEIATVSVDQADSAQSSGALLVDLRDVREVKREGKIPGSYHVPRGMLEFWVDPDSPYYHEALTAANELVLYCNLGWRSALAAKTLQDMGFTNVSHMAGGLDAWKKSGRAVEGGPSDT